MDAAACIGCGACVAACPNASAMLFVSAKISQLALLPQGQPERCDRARNMVAQMDAEGFGTCTNHGECEAACPKGIRMRVHRADERRLRQGEAHRGAAPERPVRRRLGIGPWRRGRRPAPRPTRWGPVEVAADRYWGAQTERSLHHFKIGPANASRAS